jgi:CRP-like cAMP-binding protein
MVVQLKFLKLIDYFSGCSSTELNEIKKFISEQKVEKGETFIFEGDPCDFLYFPISGVVKVYKTSTEGREQILHLQGLGGSVGDVGIFDGGPMAASTQALTPLLLYRIRTSDLKILLQNHPQVALNALRTLASRVRRDSSLVRDLSFTQVIGRLAKTLLKFVGEATHVEPRLTQQDMAAMVGTTREVVNRSLRIMEEKGAIRLERHVIVIIDKEALEKMVEPSS